MVAAPQAWNFSKTLKLGQLTSDFDGILETGEGGHAQFEERKTGFVKKIKIIADTILQCTKGTRTRQILTDFD